MGKKGLTSKRNYDIEFFMMNNMSATDLKNQGNKHYAARNYEAAVNCYSKAIVSTVHVAGRG